MVLSAEAVHTKRVDCNLLAEFCTAPGKVHSPLLPYIHAFKGAAPFLQSDLQHITVCWQSGITKAMVRVVHTIMYCHHLLFTPVHAIDREDWSLQATSTDNQAG